MKQNVVLNKVQDKINVHLGDVREVLPILYNKADRVLMPLPKTGEQFLGLVLDHTKKGGIVHYYCFGNDEEIQEITEKIESEGKKKDKKIEVLGVHKCGVAAAHYYRLCFDLCVK